MIKVTYEFATPAEALEHFKHMHTGSAPLSSPSTSKADGVYKPVADAQAAAETKPAEVPLEQKPAETAPAVDGVTPGDVRAAFKAYVNKAGGRTAATGMAILTAHGLPAGGLKVEHLEALAPEQRRVLKRAFETAGPEMPLGEAA